MDLHFYKTSDAGNVINKTLTDKLTLTVHFRNDVDVVNPVMVLYGVQLNSYNYAEIPIFNRYYFIQSVESVGNNLWRVTLECDVLETYKDEFMDEVVRFRRPLQTGDYENVSMPTDVREVVDYYKGDVVLDDEKTSLIMTVIGG